MKAIVTIGMPCSGKSTWAEKFCQENKWIEVNRDNIRLELFNLKRHVDYKFSKERENKVTEEHRKRIKYAAHKERNIVVSDTCLNDPHRETLIEYLETLGYDVETKLFDVEFFDALKRNEKRIDKYVPRKVMVDMYKKYMKYKTEIGEFQRYTPDTSKPSAYIVDIDGTIADNDGHRSFYEWDKVIDDKPIKHMIDFIRELYKTNTIILMSGRDAVSEEQTRQWCSQHGVLYDQLLMRTKGSIIKDRYEKQRMFWMIADSYNVKGVFDDRPQVALLWHDLGVPIFKVGCPISEF